jgi:hypothetical protein
LGPSPDSGADAISGRDRRHRAGLQRAGDRSRYSTDLRARIFLGQITRWNDPAIAQLNAGPTLSDARINGVHRAGSSGTT